MSESPVKLERLSDRGYLNLRGNPDDRTFIDAVQRVTGIKLPVTPNTVESADVRACWLGPDEWLLVGAGGDIEQTLASLNEALMDQVAAVNDLSGGMVSYCLSGEFAPDLLATGCTLDLNPAVFRPGCCAQTGLAKAAVLLSKRERDGAYEILVRRSFADYLWRWLLHSGRDFSIEVS